MKNKNSASVFRSLSVGQLFSMSKMAIFAAIIAVVGGSILLFSSSATSIKVTGRVYDTRTNQGIAGVRIETCNENPTVTTSSTGTWYFYIVHPSYCARIISGAPPSSWSGPATNNQSEHKTSHTYEFQHAGVNCYHNSSCTASPNEQTWDRSVDSGVDFRYTSPAPAAISSFTASPQTITTGSSTKLAWSSTGTSCTLSYGLTHSGVPGSGSVILKPGATTTYSLTCSGPGGSSAAKSLTVTVNKPPAPPPKPPGGGGGGGSGSGSGGSGGSTTPTTKPAVKDTSAPSSPSNFSGAVDSSSQTVQLSWSASTDNVGVKNYLLERSDDGQKNWLTMSDNITDTSYDDLTAGFGKDYVYRLRAFDAAGNSSGYATTKVGVGGFQANATASQDSTISSDDKKVSVTLPAGAVSQDTFCSLMISTDIAVPTIQGYLAIDGPYLLNCRDAAGDVIVAFEQPLVLNTQLGKADLKNVGKVAYYGQKDDGSWESLPITSHDAKNHKDKIDLQNHTVFVIMGQHKKGPPILKIVLIIILIAILIFVIRFINQRRAKYAMEKAYDDYLRKAKGL